MAAPETGKQRASRIPLDYYKRPDRLERWKRRLLLAAPLAALAWWGGSWLLREDRGQRLYSHGPLAAAHATWEANCDACHEPFAPISRQAAWSAPLTGKGRGGPLRCETCHAGPPHHLTQKAEDTPTCAGCHRDHRGAEASLVRVPDGDCTSCHGDLGSHMREGAGPGRYAPRITGFDRNHPEFRVLRENAEDPGRLKFNHRLHLTEGMRLEDGGKPFTLAQIRDPRERERYRREGQAGEAAVQLDCASCHGLEPGGRGKSATSAEARLRPQLQAPASGAYMRPVTYENHCRACHPLTLPAPAGAGPRAKPLTVPHHLQPGELRNFLWGAYAAEYAAGKPELAERLKAPPFPGRGPEATEEERARREVTGRVGRAELLLYLGKTTCGECHYYEAAPGKVTPERVLAPDVPETWFPSARFDHAAHRAVDCRLCHEKADQSATSKDVLLPGIQVCLDCHAPAKGSGGAVSKGGARFDCVECHRYHHGDGPAEGVGSRARGAADGRRLNLPEFRAGGREPH